MNELLALFRGIDPIQQYAMAGVVVGLLLGYALLLFISRGQA